MRTLSTTAFTRFTVLAAVVLLGAGCSLFDTRGAEGNDRRGPQGFDPYVGGRSSAVRLALQYYKDCAIAANGEPLGKGAANIPYPQSCSRDPSLPPAAGPAQPMPLLTGTDYFLGQLALADQISNAHLDPLRPEAATEWIINQSLLKGLNWSGLGVTSDQVGDSAVTVPGVYDRTVLFGNAAWQTVFDDTFKVELLDADGNARSEQTYRRLDLLAQNQVASHTRLAWTLSNLGAPQFYGDLAVHPAPTAPPNVAPIGPLSSQVLARMELMTQAHPDKTISVAKGLTGDGAFRVTWSQLPGQPFYFPVRFVSPDARPQSCFTPEGAAVACTFGLVPEITFSTPSNGTYYLPGEEFEATIAAKDGAGNLLHPVDAMPSWNDYFRGQSNGLLYFNLFPLLVYGELDSISGVALAGPLQNMRFVYERGQRTHLKTAHFMKGGFTDNGLSFMFLPTAAAAVGALHGGQEAPVPTHYQFRVPDDAPAGTYVLELKLHRAFMGERMSKAVPFMFQVGQAEPTRFPGRVGNCQLCHRSTLSLENVRHGLPVDFVEGCKTCHNIDETAGSVSVEVIHNVHMTSGKFPRAKNDCAVCHLTRESTLRPSLAVCGSCHGEPHGGQYFQMAIEPNRGPPNGAPNKFSNCAQACHALKPPTSHLVPAL